jgi:UDP-N-acetylglucosamine acyltransferase
VVGDNTFIGGQSGVHQFVRIGEGAMIAGHTGVAADIIPFGFAVGQRAVLDGMNNVGLRRRGHGRDDLARLRRAYRQLFLGSGLFRDRLAQVERDYVGDPLVGTIITFIRSGGKRPLTMPASGGTASERSSEPS